MNVPLAAGGPLRIPMTVKTDAHVDAVLIDDDAMMRKAWAMCAAQAGKALLVVCSFPEFMRNVHRVGRDTNIYIDYQLADGVEGCDVAKQLHSLGYRSLFLATGRAQHDVEPLPFLKAVLDKTPPFLAQGSAARSA